MDVRGEASDPLLELVAARYNAPEEIDKYRARARSGLLDWEKTVCERYHSRVGRVLDIGCGCGREAIAVAALGHAVTGIDLSSAQIEIARETALRAGCRIDFRPTSGGRLDFPNDSFDHVLIWSQVIGNVPGRNNRLQLLREVFRVMATPGTLSLSAHNRPVCEPIALRKGMIQQSSGIALEDGDFILAGDSPASGSCYWHYFTREELAGLIGSSGFDAVECDVAPAFGQTGPDPRNQGWDTLLVAVARKG